MNPGPAALYVLTGQTLMNVGWPIASRAPCTGAHASFGTYSNSLMLWKPGVMRGSTGFVRL